MELKKKKTSVKFMNLNFKNYTTAFFSFWRSPPSWYKISNNTLLCSLSPLCVALGLQEEV